MKCSSLGKRKQLDAEENDHRLLNSFSSFSHILHLVLLFCLCPRRVFCGVRGWGLCTAEQHCWLLGSPWLLFCLSPRIWQHRMLGSRGKNVLPWAELSLLAGPQCLEAQMPVELWNHTHCSPPVSLNCSNSPSRKYLCSVCQLGQYIFNLLNIILFESALASGK